MDPPADTYGYSDNFFISEVEEDLHCCICSFVVCDPVMISCCRHKFCSLCFDRVKTYAENNNSQLRCPVHRHVMDMSDVQEDMETRRLINNLPVRCPLYKRGCQWTGNLQRMICHAQICQHNPLKLEDSTGLSDSQPQRQLNSDHDIRECSLSGMSKQMAPLKLEQQLMKEEFWFFRQMQNEMVAVKEKNSLLEETMSLLVKSIEKQEHQRQQQQHHQQQLQCEIVALQEKNSMLQETMLQLVKDIENQEQQRQQQEQPQQEQQQQQQQQPQTEAQQQRMELAELLLEVATLRREVALCRREKQVRSRTISDTSGKLSLDVSKKEPASTKKTNRVIVNHHCGDPRYLNVSNDNHRVEFHGHMVSVCAGCAGSQCGGCAFVPPGSKVWYEIECIDGGGGGWNIIGWATFDFPTSQTHVSEWVGGGTHSYGFNPFHGEKWHDGDAKWGKKFTGGRGVVGAALDLVKGEILYSVNGQWTSPMGVAFTDIPTDKMLFPAITGGNSTLLFNFGDRGFRYGPPDSAYKTLMDAVVV